MAYPIFHVCRQAENDPMLSSTAIRWRLRKRRYVPPPSSLLFACQGCVRDPKCGTSHDRGEGKKRHPAPRRIPYGPEERRPRHLPERDHQERETQTKIGAIGKQRDPPQQESAARYDIRRTVPLRRRSSSERGLRR